MKFCFFLISLIFCQLSFSQKYEFIGFMKSDEIGLVPYKINFDVDDNDSIRGVSTFDFKGKNKTSSVITGVYNQKKKRFFFKEVENISSKTALSQDDFCFIYTEKIKVSSANENITLSGDFSSKYANGEVCVSGKIYLISSSILDVISENLDAVASDSLKDKSQVAQELLTAFKHEKSILTSGESLQINVKSDSLVLEVWDNYKEDNDIISLYFNDEVVAENLVIRGTKKQFVLAVPPSGGRIRVEAVNEGDLPMNTVDFVIKTDAVEIPFSIRLKTGETVSVHVTN